MKKIFTICLLLICTQAFCQQGGISINPNGGPPDSSAALDINYNNKGLLMPRLTSVQMSGISSPARGLAVFNTDSGAYYYYNGTMWTNLPATGVNPGDMLYWTGTNWVVLPIGASGEVLTVSNGAPTWTSTLPTVLSTTAATAITGTTAVSGGDVSSAGFGSVTAYGVCWSTSPNPVLGVGNYTTDGAGTGTFVSNITGLTGSTTYYVRAYATNGIGTAYGPQISFTTNTPPVTIGQSYQGGIVAYILQPDDAGYNANVQHGLIAATSDQSANIPWYNGTYTTTGATGTAIGTGASNTALIIAAQVGGSYAASICTAYTGGGYNDWYLPSLNELNELYLNIGQGNALSLGNVGGFASYYYWSSSEYDTNDAWLESFSGGNQVEYYDKSLSIYVRAIRSF